MIRMKFTLDKSSLETFNKTRMLELEGLYSPEKVREINREIDALIPKDKIGFREEIMKFGRDLTRKSESFKRAIGFNRLGEIAYELISVRPLRLAFDQVIVAASNSFDEQRATTFLNDTGSLNQKSGINEIVLGVIIALNAKEENLPFAGTEGRAVFFGPDIPIPFEFLKNRLADRYLLIAFSTVHAQYLYNDNDPQNHYLKKEGFVYGDRLKDSTHPIIYR